ncbi:Glutathione S-transferase [Chamberlinius hualienensis]
MGAACTIQPPNGVLRFTGTGNKPSIGHIELYYVPQSPPCRAVLLTIKAIGIPVTLRKLDMHQRAEHKQVWFLSVNPIHTVPAMDDNGFTLWESRVIMAYLVQKYARDDSLYPKEIQQRSQVDKMLYFDIGVLYKGIIDYWNPQLFDGKPASSQKANVLKQSLEYLDEFLKSGRYICGSTMTIADLSLLASVTALEAYEYDYSSCVNIKRWVEQLKVELPYYSECVANGIDIQKTWIKTTLKNK